MIGGVCFMIVHEFFDFVPSGVSDEFSVWFHPFGHYPLFAFWHLFSFKFRDGLSIMLLRNIYDLFGFWVGSLVLAI
jgi:hypothetical protein